MADIRVCVVTVVLILTTNLLNCAYLTESQPGLTGINKPLSSV